MVRQVVACPDGTRAKVSVACAGGRAGLLMQFQQNCAAAYDLMRAGQRIDNVVMRVVDIGTTCH